MQNNIIVLFLITALNMHAQEIPRKIFFLKDSPDLQQNLPTIMNQTITSGIGMKNYGSYLMSDNFRPFPGSSSTQSEFSIDINPNDENKLLLSANTTNWPVTLFYGTGTYFSSDRGFSWYGSDYPPNGFNYGYPSAAIGRNGLYYNGFLNLNMQQSISVSADEGNTWNNYVIASVPSGNNILDKNHLTVDKYENSRFKDRLYSGWTRFQSGHANNNKIEISYSTDNGKSWSVPKNISAGVNAGSHDYGINLQTGAEGNLYCAWAVYDEWNEENYAEDAIGFNVSTDGGITWDTAKRIYDQSNFGINGYIKSSGIRVASFPAMSVDLSRNIIYISWAIKGINSTSDIICIKSTDNGNSWSTPVIVNNGNGKDQYYNWSTVDQKTGYLYVLFYDNRNTANDSSEVFLARSTDGGNTFENICVSGTAFKPKPIAGMNDGYQGDYIGVAALNNNVYCVWGDDRTGNYQAWMTKLQFLPELIHTPLSNTEEEGPYRIEVEIKSGIELNVNKLYLHYSTDYLTRDSVLLKPQGNKYFGFLPGSSVPCIYKYYLIAEDINGGVNQLPIYAPTDYFSFRYLSDTAGPVISHIPIRDQVINKCPIELTTEITDDFGVAVANVEFRKNREEIQTLLLTNTNGNTWSARFPYTPAMLTPGDTIYYRIYAVDNSRERNSSYLPSSGYYSFRITESGTIVLLIDDEDEIVIGKSSVIFRNKILSRGIAIDYTRFRELNTSILNKYDCIILCAGTKTTGIFDDPARRKAIVDYNKAGGKVFVEGGEVGWIYRYSSVVPEKDPQFRRTILKDSTWVNDYSSGMLTQNDTGSIFFNYPEEVEDSIRFRCLDPEGETDVVNILPNTPGIYKLAGFISRFPDTAGVIVYSPLSEFKKITNVYCTFAFSAIVNTVTAEKLAGNLIDYLLYGIQPVPVEMNSFNISMEGNQVSLHWSTSSELNNSGFLVERSSGKEYKIREFIKGAGTSTIKNEYTFTERLEPGKYFYRISQNDFNGSVRIIKETELNYSEQLEYELNQNYPNPFNSSTVIEYKIIEDNYVKIILFNTLGEKVAELKNSYEKAGKHKLEFNGKMLPSGVYFYTIEAGEFKKSRKFMIIK